MGITKRDGQWYCSEVIADTNLGYGTYVFTVKGRVDLFDENVALGLFTWEDCASKCNFREIDIEISKWSNPEIVNAQFVVQPHTNPLNIIRFNIDCSEYDVTTHEFTWKPDSVDFQSYYGDYPLMDPKFLIEDGNWSYTGDDIPTEGMEKPHINFWLASGLPPTDDQDTEITIKNFRYLPIFGNYNNDNNVDFADFATYQAN